MSSVDAEAALDRAINRWARAWHERRNVTLAAELLAAWHNAKLPPKSKDGKTVLLRSDYYVMYAIKRGSRVDYYMRIAQLPRPFRNPLRSYPQLLAYCRDHLNCSASVS